MIGEFAIHSSTVNLQFTGVCFSGESHGIFSMHRVKLSHGHERDMVKSCPTRIDRRQKAQMTRHHALTETYGRAHGKKI
jgi:hypothetical protein